MRSIFHPSPATGRHPRAIGRAATDRSVAEVLLGARHPLVGVLRRADTAFEQLVSVTALQAAGVAFLGSHRLGLSVAIAGAVVQVGLGCQFAALRARRRQLCLELIVGGRQGLPVFCIDRERRRLLDPRTLKKLAGSIDEMLEIAARSLPLHPAARPIFYVRVIRRVSPELRELASVLRGDRPCVRGVAAVELLLRSPASPLYGVQVEPLRQELGRARYLVRVAP